MRNLLITLSDIHYSVNNSFEDQGVVINSFLEDISEQIKKLDYDDVFVLLGGDLVSSGETENYNAFNKNVIRPIIRILNIDINHIFVTPGNHDLNRDAIIPVYKEHHNQVLACSREKAFNDLIRDPEKKDLLFSKFYPYYQFMAQKLNQSVGEYSAYSYNIDDLWTVLCVNSAILSEGGLNDWNDERNLSVDTRAISEWVMQNRTRKKILLMHHPIHYLSEDFEHELLEIVRKDFDLVITGHTHYHMSQMIGQTIILTNPKLFTTKTETLGYGFVCIDDMGVDKIIYRQWAKERRRFTYGINFAQDDSNMGEDIIRKPTVVVEDLILRYYKTRLSQALSLFKNQPDIWIKRYVTAERLDYGLKSINDYQLFSEEELIQRGESFYLYSPADGGLTCYGLNFLVKLREIYGKIGLFVSSNTRNVDKFQQQLIDSMSVLQIPLREDVSWVVLDQWHDDEVSRQKYNMIQSQYPNASILFMTNQRERVDMNEDGRSMIAIEGVEKYYLAPMDRNQLRMIAGAYSQRDNQLDYKLLKRLDDDLRDFNMHRSPLNCITLLESFYQTKFEEYPINRTAVLSKFLSRMFENTDLLYETTYPTMQECEYATGYFCAQLIREIASGGRHANSAMSFKRGQFECVAQTIFDKQGTEIGANVLFDILCASKIIVPYDAWTYTFRFRTWVYYFAATWMNVDSEFADFILSEGRYLHYPDVIEFYTGITKRQSDALIVLTRDLNEVVDRVKVKLNVKEDYNPFDYLHLDLSQGARKRVVAIINKHIQSSSLPQDVKDHMIDQSYIPSSPYNQTVYRDVMEYTVQQMYANIEISSKALRNTTLVDLDIKENLLSAILSAWSVFAKVVSYMSKEFAHNNEINIDGLRFSLVEDYKLLDEEYRRISIIENIPYNIMLLFQGHIYSPKMGRMLNDFFTKESDRIRKHLLACLIVSKTPTNWNQSIESYIKAQRHDSFYLSNILKALADRKALSEPQENIIIPVNTLLAKGMNKIDTNHADGGARVLLNTGINMADVPRIIKTKNRKKKNKYRKR